MSVLRLVAAREIAERVRARSFLVSTVVSAALVVAVIVLPAVVGDGNPDRPRYDVGIVEPASDAARTVIAQVAAAVDVDVAVRAVADAAAADRAVRDGSLDVALVGGRELVVPRPLDLTDGSARSRFVAGLSQTVGLQTMLEAAGLSPAEVAAALAAPALPTRAVGPPEEGSDGPTRSGTVAFVGSLILYTFLSQYGVWILNGVVEEKSSRVVEVLLSTMSPRQLLSGKVTGVGVVALLQGVVIASAAIVTAALVGSNTLDDVSLTTVATMLGWFVLGYGFYSWVYAAAGSLVSRQEEAQNVAFPLTLPLLVGYIASTTVAFGSSNGFARVLSFLPPTAPVVMPVRVAVDDAAPWEVAVAVALVVAGTAGAMRLSAAVYGRAVMHTGGRLRWRQALRAPA